MKLDPRQLEDFIRLAKDRCEQQVRSVTQLMDDGPQVFVLSVALAVMMIKGAAELMQEGVAAADGEQIEYDEALNMTLGHVLDALDVRYERRTVRKK